MESIAPGFLQDMVSILKRLKRRLADFSWQFKRQQVILAVEEEPEAEKQVITLAVEEESQTEQQYRDYIDTLAPVIQYRQAYFEARGDVAPNAGVPTTHAWPEEDKGISYEQKLLGMLELSTGKGVELGPLNIPVTSKETSNVLYVDHLNTDGLREKYPTVQGIVEIDRPMVNNSLKDTLDDIAPLDYLVASQVFEHVPNPIRWLKEVAAVLRIGGLLALSLPDRRFTFDFLRAETQASDIVSAYFEDITTPNIRCVYDHHSLASFINMGWASPESVLPEQIVSGRGKIKPKIAAEQYMSLVYKAQAGEYLDVHAWVFTPPSFLLVMAQLATEGFLPFRLRQFYPTNTKTPDRGSSSFTIILERVADDISLTELRGSYLEPLGEGTTN